MLQIQERIHENEFTAIFILSDGCDTCGNNLNNILKTMEKRDKHIKTDYQIHSFGYGEDHDEKVLSEMRNFKNGKFYYIDSDDIVDECFIDCMGNLLTVIGKNVEIKLTMSKYCKLLQTHGKYWKSNTSAEGVAKLSVLTSDNSNELLVEIELSPVL